ncbi:MAG: NAD-dependent epimerase/dehydratase family protein, partial [Deltaproteobacteria bacterium]|nr:NAD-dependent epimerase/dehydratase family protein [Deltaproteobacteria bacterium]
MVLLETTSPSSGRPLTVAIFGTGLIGSAIVSRLQASASLHKQEVPFNWTADSSIQLRQLQDVETRILNGPGPNTEELTSCSKPGVGLRSLRIVWSAGRAGFGASHDETERELYVFRMVLDMAERLAMQYPGDPVSFYLTSSAGGLFEGQRHVDQSSR